MPHRLRLPSSLFIPAALLLSVAAHAAVFAVVVGIYSHLSGGGSTLAEFITVRFVPADELTSAGPPSSSTETALFESLTEQRELAPPPPQPRQSAAKELHPQRKKAAAPQISPEPSADAGSGAGAGTTVGDGVAQSSELRTIAAPLPRYPAAARRMRFEGTSLLDLQVARSGAVSSVDIAQSAGRSDCDEEARRTVLEQWRFEPIEEPRKVRLAVRFELEPSHP